MSDQPTELTIKDVEDFIEKLENGDFEPKKRDCFKCGKKFYANYDINCCDECYFSQFSKESVKKFYQKIIEDMIS